MDLSLLVTCLRHCGEESQWCVLWHDCLQIDKYGKFKRWHAWGSLIVATSFSSVFGGCWACNLVGAKSTKALVHSYSFFAAVFNLGWAAAQVSHM